MCVCIWMCECVTLVCWFNCTKAHHLPIAWNVDIVNDILLLCRYHLHSLSGSHFSTMSTNFRWVRFFREKCEPLELDRRVSHVDLQQKPVVYRSTIDRMVQSRKLSLTYFIPGQKFFTQKRSTFQRKHNQQSKCENASAVSLKPRKRWKKFCCWIMISLQMYALFRPMN